MDYNQILQNPGVLFIVGLMWSEWRQSRNGQNSQAGTTAAFDARIRALEAFQIEHRDVRETLASLTQQLKTVFNAVSDLRDGFDEWMTPQSKSGSRRRRRLN